MEESLAQVLTQVHEDGLPSVTNRYYALYRATVVSNQDPMMLGRVQIKCGATQGSPDTWVKPAFDSAGAGRGFFFVPEAGDTVFVSFYEGDPQRPEVYFGGWYGKSDGSTSDVPTFLQPPASLYPEKKGIVTRAGHVLVFNDEAGKESFTLIANQPAARDPALTDRTKTAAYNAGTAPASPAFNGQKLGATILTSDATGFLLKTPSSFVFRIDETTGSLLLAAPNGAHFAIMTDGSVQMVNKSGATIMATDKGVTITADPSQNQTVNISGASVSLNGGSINLGSAATDFAVLGLKLMAWLQAHTHSFIGVPPTAPGMTTPGSALPPLTPALFCSTSVAVSP